MQKIIQLAVEDAVTLEGAGVGALIIEGMGDDLFLIRLETAQSTVMAVMSIAVRQSVSLPIGIDAAMNGYRSAISIAQAISGESMRIPVFVDTVYCGGVSIIPPYASQAMRYRKDLGTEHIRIFADIQAKHTTVVVPNTSLEDSARTTQDSGADALTVTDTRVGQEAPIEIIERVKRVVGLPVLVGSDIDTGNMRGQVKIADGMIIGSGPREGGVLTNPISYELTKAPTDKLRQHALPNDVGERPQSQKRKDEAYMTIMRPMKLASSELTFGRDCLGHIKTIKGTRVTIVMLGGNPARNSILDKVRGYLKEVDLVSEVLQGVEPDLSFATVIRGTKAMLGSEPDAIVAPGGDSAMNVAKDMWIHYEHPELTSLANIMAPNPFPVLCTKARMVCIPSTSGTASEISRSIVITDEHKVKHGIDNIEMMPGIAIRDLEVTASIPGRITAETGMDALTHTAEAYVSRRANRVSGTLAAQVMRDVFEYLPKAYEESKNLNCRKKMQNASMIAGLALTNVSLGIVHSIAHTLGSYFGLAHGLADAVVLPCVISYNSADPEAAWRYGELAALTGKTDFAATVCELNQRLGIPASIVELVPDQAAYEAMLTPVTEMALTNGCTKTNPIIPGASGFARLFQRTYKGWIP